MQDIIALHFDPHTLKGIAIGFGGFLLLLLILVSILKPFFISEQRYFGRRRRQGSGFMTSFVIAICLIAGVQFNSTTPTENNQAESEAQEEIDQEKSVTDDNYRENGSDIFFQAEQQQKKEKETVTEKRTPLPSPKKELEGKKIRVNQRPSHSNMSLSPRIQRVETSTSNIDRSFTPKSKIYYIQLSAARTLDDGQNSVAHHATAYPEQVFLTKIIDDETGFPFKILIGPFPTSLNAHNAVRGKRGIVRSELDEDLIFIDY